MKRRAFIFTLDALLALILVMVFISSLGVFTTNVNIYGTYFREQEKLAAEDILTMYKTVPLKNLVSPAVLLNWTTEGIIDESFVSPEMPPLEIVATYWSLDAVFPDRELKDKAEKMVGYLLSITLKDHNYELLIENYTSPYLKNVSTGYSEARDVSAATLILSGYEFNQTPRGYVARAYITRLTSRRAIYMYFTGAANSTSSNITITFLVPNEEENLLPPDASITGIKWFFEPIDKDSTISLFIDGIEVKCNGLNGPPYLLKDFDPNNPQDCNMLEILREKGDLRQHEFKIEVSDANNAGIRPNGYVVLYYDTAKLNVVEYPKTFYFDGVEANGTFEIIKGVFIPGNLTSITVNIKLNTSISPNNLNLSIIVPNESADVDVGGPTCYNGLYSWNYTAINSSLGSLDILSRRYVWFKIIVNVSKPIKLDPTESFVEIDYIPNVPKTLYTMDIIAEVNGTNIVSSNEYKSDEYDFVWNATIPTYAIPLWARFNFVLDVSANITGLAVSPGSLGNWTVVFDDPSLTPLTSVRWLLINNMKNSSNEAITALVPGENYVGIETNSQIGNYTIGELVYSVEVYVPYGEIKPFLLQNYPEVVAYNLTYKYEYDATNRSIIVGDPQAIDEGRYMNITAADLNPEEYAVDDAILSLFEKLGGDGWADPIDVDIADTKISFVSLEGIPKAIKPIRVTLRVWRED